MTAFFRIASSAFFLVALFQEMACSQPAFKISPTEFKKDTFNIVSYGAVADGITMNTKSINEAIAACNHKGGGVVLIPEGIWVTGPLVLSSNVNLHLARNAVLQFTKDLNEYPLVQGNWEGLPQMRNQSPISAKNVVNIAITGHGIIDGNGDAWRMVKKDKLNETQWKKLIASGGVLSADKKTWYPSDQSLKGATLKNPGVISPEKTMAFYDSIKDFLRPNLLVFENCKKVLLEDVTFQNSPAWCLHPLMCEDLRVTNIYAKNPWYAQNGDGIDIESCKNVLIENSTFDVGDDGICIKSGRDESGRKRGKPTENVIIRHCTVYHAHGGFVIGSEMSGGARDIYVSDCTFMGTDVGLRFKTTRGRGGIAEKIYVTNITMKDIAGQAILFDMYYMAQDPMSLTGENRDPPLVEMMPVTEATPQFKDFHISNVVCDGAETAIFVRGLPEMNVKEVYLENLVLQSKEGMNCTEATGLHLKNIKLITDNTNPVINIHNSKDVSLDKIGFKNRATLFLKISGEKSGNIRLLHTETLNARQKAVFSSGATEKSLISE